MTARVDAATSRFLDATRWMAALGVVVSHASALVIGPGAAAGDAVLLYLQNVGHLAVVIFFVVSGYLVGGIELLRAMEGRRFDVWRYGVQRFSRIYAVLVPALVLTAVLDWVGRGVFDGSGLYSEPGRQRVGSLMYSVAGRDDVWTFLGNLGMLQTIFVEPFGGNGPLWSLANEWWYYVAFGLLLLAVTGLGRGVRVAALGGGVLLLGVLPVSISVWGLIWLMGVGAALLGRRWRGLEVGGARVVMGVGFGLALLGMRFGGELAGWPEGVRVLGRLGIDGVAAGAFTVGLLSARNGRAAGSGVHAVLAGFSYTLYAVHFPVLLLLGAMAHDVFGMGFNQVLGVGSLGVVAAMCAVVWGFAWGFSLVTERRTPVLRGWLMGLRPGGVA